MIIVIYIFSCLVFIVKMVKIPCEFSSQTWEPTNTYQLTQRQIVVSTRYGFDMIVDAQDQTVSKVIRTKGFWDSSMLHVIAFFLKPGMKVLNLGPQTGLQAIVMGNIIGSQGKMYICEPFSPSYAIVKKNIYLNDLQDFTALYKVGASDVQSQQTILVFPDNTGAAQIFSKSSFPSKASQRIHQQQKVKIDLIDNVLPIGIQLDFALIDVQKMQVEALLGMKRIIQRSPNLVIIVEWSYLVNSHRNEQKTIRCLNWLKSLNYKFYQYKTNKRQTCHIGQFSIINDPLLLLRSEPFDLILIPQQIDPNKMKQ